MIFLWWDLGGTSRPVKMSVSHGLRRPTQAEGFFSSPAFTHLHRYTASFCTLHFQRVEEVLNRRGGRKRHTDRDRHIVGTMQPAGKHISKTLFFFFF